MLKKISFMAGALILAALAFAVSRKTSEYLNFRAAAAEPIHVQPFTAELITIGRDGSVTEDRTVARRADGTESTTFAYDSDGKFTARRIDGADGNTTAMFDSVAAKFSFWRDAKQIAYRKQALTHPPVNCVFPGETFVSRDQIQSEIAYAATTPDGHDRKTGHTLHLVQWRAPELNCQVVRMQLDDLTAHQTIARQSPRFIVRGEPSSDLFDRRADYRELKPSSLRAAIFAHYGVKDDPCPTCSRAGWDATADAKYQQAQRPPQ